MEITKERSVPGRIHLPAELYRFAWALAVLMGVCLGTNLYWRRVMRLYWEPYATPFFRETYPDFLAFMPRFQTFRTMRFFTFPGPPFMYPAPVAVVYRMAYLVPRHPLLIFLLFGLAAFSLAALLFGRLLVRRGYRASEAYGFAFATLLCSYPFWFAGKQANMEIVIWIVVAAGLGFFLSHRGYSAAVCFGIAASMKVYPLVYLGLLLVRRQYRQVAAGVATFVGVTIASLWIVYPNLAVSWRNINAGVDRFRFMYMLQKRPEIGMDHSLFAVIKRSFHPYPSFDTIAHLMTLYLAVAAIGGVALFFLRLRKLPVVNQILCLTIASILFPPVSFEYTLLHLFVPFAMVVLLIVEHRQAGSRLPWQNFLLCSFALLFSFLAELIHHGFLFGGEVKSLVLLALFIFAAWKPLQGPDTRQAIAPAQGSGAAMATEREPEGIFP